METATKIVGVLVALIIICLLMAWSVMILWNWLMPVIFGLKTITFWQALGLSTLCSLLFKSSNYQNKKD